MTDSPQPAADQGATPRRAAPFEQREPKYDWGIRVTANADLFNDGSHPEAEPGALLVPQGTPGEIVRVGTLPDGNIPIYLVEFPAGVLVGCFEEEITPTLGERRSAVPGRL